MGIPHPHCGDHQTRSHTTNHEMGSLKIGSRRGFVLPRIASTTQNHDQTGGLESSLLKEAQYRHPQSRVSYTKGHRRVGGAVRSVKLLMRVRVGYGNLEIDFDAIRIEFFDLPVLDGGLTKIRKRYGGFDYIAHRLP